MEAVFDLEAARYPRRRDIPASVDTRAQMLRYTDSLRSCYPDAVPVSAYVVLSPVRAVPIDADGRRALTTNPPMGDRLDHAPLSSSNPAS